MTTSLSLVIPTYNEGAELLRTLASLLPSLPEGSEVIVADDGSTDGSVAAARARFAVRTVATAGRLGPAGARNAGAASARGDVLVFADAHVRAPADWADAVLPALAEPGVGAVGTTVARLHHPEVQGSGLRFCDAATNLEWLPRRGSTPHPVPVLGGFFFAMRRSVFEQTGGLDGGMSSYGMEDPELSVRLWLLGYRCLIVPDVVVRHLFRVADHQQDWETGLHNVLRFGVLHLGRARLASLFDHYRDDGSFARALTRLVDSDVWERRAWLHERRVADDDWFFAEINDAWGLASLL